MFFQGYLEALTDIDGDQREFGVRVKMFNSSNKNHISDIEKEFGYTEPIEVSDSQKSFRNYDAVSHILEKLIFVKFFNGAEVPKKSVESFRDYVIFHLSDYINFAFIDFDVKDKSDIEWFYRRRIELLIKRGEKINTIFLVVASDDKKLIFRFYRNKKYVSDKAFDKWYKNIFSELAKKEKSSILKEGVSQSLINDFLYKEYDKEDILDLAEQISICETKKSKSIEKICAKEQWKLKKLIPLFAKGLDDIYGNNLDSIEEIAKLRVIRAMWKVKHEEENMFQKRLKYMLKAVKTYNKKFQTKKSLKNYKENNKYGDAISPELHYFLYDFEKIINTYKNDTAIIGALQKKYKKESYKEVWREINSMLKEIKINHKEG